MSGPETPSNNTPDDRLLEDFLAGRGEVVQHYRQLEKSQAPNALDDAVLAVAREELAATPTIRTAPRWQRLRMPVALAATVVLGLGVMLNIQRDPEAYHAAVTPVAVPELAPPIATDPMREEAAPAMAATVHAAPPPPAVVATPSAAPAKRKQEAEKVTAEKSFAEAPAPVPSPAVSAPMPTAAAPAASMMQSETKQRSEFMGRQALQRQRSMASEAMAADAVQTQVEPIQTAATWVARIRALREQGQEEAAREEWRQYRLEFPDEPIPEDLRGYEPEPLQ